MQVSQAEQLKEVAPDTATAPARKRSKAKLSSVPKVKKVRAKKAKSRVRARWGGVRWRHEASRHLRLFGACGRRGKTCGLAEQEEGQLLVANRQGRNARTEAYCGASERVAGIKVGWQASRLLIEPARMLLQ